MREPLSLLIAAVMTMAALSVAAQEEAAGGAPAPCAAPEYRQFDFWVGEWDVTRAGDDAQVATSLIEKLYDGCAIRENWRPLGRSGGGSLNSFLPALGVWRQIWTDSNGSWNVFEGGMSGESMILLGHRLGNDPQQQAVLARMTFTPGDDGSVRQHGEHSTDFGRTWRTSYDFIYRPHSNSGGGG